MFRGAARGGEQRGEVGSVVCLRERGEVLGQTGDGCGWWHGKVLLSVRLATEFPTREVAWNQRRNFLDVSGGWSTTAGRCAASLKVCVRQ